MSEISDFKIKDGKLIKYIGEGVDVVIPDSVTEIGSKAFYDHRGLISVHIPSSVKKIGNDAFGCCSNLTTVNIPEGIMGISKYVFAFCYGLKTINIPAGVKKIGEGAFSSCSSLESIVIPDSVKTIEDHAFQGCKNLANITVPESVSQIGDYVFHDCTGVKTLKIGSVVMLKEMEKMRFNYSSGLFMHEKTLKLDYLVSSFYNTKLAEFAGSDSIRFVYTGSVKDIKDKGIKVKAITEILKKNPEAPSPDEEELKYINNFIKKNADLFDDEVVKEYASGNSALNISPIEIKNNEDNAGEKATVGQLKRLWKIKDIDETSVEIIGYKGDSDIAEIPPKIGKKAVLRLRNSSKQENFGRMKEVIIPYGVKEIDQGTFYFCVNLECIQIPDSVTEIGERAFGQCRSLRNILLPNSIKIINWLTFAGCESLTNIIIPSSITKIGWRAFHGCKNLTNIIISNSVTEIEGEVFSGCENLTIHAPKGSCAEHYASKWRINFEAL